MRSDRWIAWGLAMTLCMTACKKNSTSAARGDAGGATSAQVIGMVDPFARLSSESGKLLSQGYKALKAKKWDEARGAFSAVVATSPDYSPARFALVRTLALSGSF